MAKKDKNVTTSASAEDNKGKKKNDSAGKRRSMGDLLKNDKGKIIMVVRGSAGLSNKNDQSLLVEKDPKTGKDVYIINGKDKAERAKNLAGRLNSIVKPGGKIDSLDENSKEYTTLKSNASKALKSLASGKYDASVNDFLAYVLDTFNAGGGGGSRGFNANNFNFTL